MRNRSPGMAVMIENKAPRSLRANARIEHKTATSEAAMIAMPTGTKTDAPNQSLSECGTMTPTITPKPKISTGQMTAPAVNMGKDFTGGSSFIKRDG